LDDFDLEFFGFEIFCSPIEERTNKKELKYGKNHPQKRCGGVIRINSPFVLIDIAANMHVGIIFKPLKISSHPFQCFFNLMVSIVKSLQIVAKRRKTFSTLPCFIF